jgi:hypothetical protein
MIRSCPAHRYGWHVQALVLMAVLLAPTLASAACAEVRVRKEWRALSSSERQRFLQAVRKLQARPAPDQPSKYDQLVKRYADHSEAMSASSAFLPWHRHYLRVFEQELRQIDPTVTLPYWDWSAHSRHPEQSPIWGADAFGGNGRGPASCVVTGAFRAYRPFYPKDSCLRRAFSKGETLDDFSSAEELRTRLTQSADYDSMRKALESAQGFVHLYIGGHMAAFHAPSDPLFFLHHAFVDKLWADWQRLQPEHLTAYGGENRDGSPATLEDTLPGFPEITVESVIRTQSLCYTYP